MTPNVARYLNKTVFVSIPALFDDGVCRPFTLLGAELNGLWLQSDELTRRLLAGHEGDLPATSAPAVFVPFAQIAGVLVAGAPSQSPEQQPVLPPAPARERSRRRKTATRTR
jgi:hypothetical protein